MSNPRPPDFSKDEIRVIRDMLNQSYRHAVVLQLADAEKRLNPALTEMTLPHHRVLGNRRLPLRGGQGRQVSFHATFLLPPVSDLRQREAMLRRPARLRGQSVAGPGR